MRVLTVRQPWAEAIIFGGKNVENRPRNIAGDYRGPVAIHTGLYKPKPEEWRSFERDHPDAMARMMNTVPWAQEEFGVIIGVVDLVHVHTADDAEQTKNLRGLWPTCSPWAERSGWHLALINPRPLAQPIPFKGALGLRKLDDDMIARITEAIV